ncbi:MAG: hypothetical protein QXU98_04095 [Candidatus Parvarchaeota archaeon]
MEKRKFHSYYEIESALNMDTSDAQGYAMAHPDELADDFEDDSLFRTTTKQSINADRISKLLEQRKKLLAELDKLDKSIKNVEFVIDYNEYWEDWKAQKESRLGERKDEIEEKLKANQDKLAALGFDVSQPSEPEFII